MDALGYHSHALDDIRRRLGIVTPGRMESEPPTTTPAASEPKMPITIDLTSDTPRRATPIIPALLPATYEPMEGIKLGDRTINGSMHAHAAKMERAAKEAQKRSSSAPSGRDKRTTEEGGDNMDHDGYTHVKLEDSRHATRNREGEIAMHDITATTSPTPPTPAPPKPLTRATAGGDRGRQTKRGRGGRPTGTTNPEGAGGKQSKKDMGAPKPDTPPKETQTETIATQRETGKLKAEQKEHAVGTTAAQKEPENSNKRTYAAAASAQGHTNETMNIPKGPKHTRAPTRSATQDEPARDYVPKNQLWQARLYSATNWREKWSHPAAGNGEMKTLKKPELPARKDTPHGGCRAETGTKKHRGSDQSGQTG
ncbi:hypothetical protein BDZ91DRAFT_799537 [Kalaharituber pfeilii]|nr:hypothetical protein BDZ91DRAFT_799537 [Kalaharituber pfeilii]